MQERGRGGERQSEERKRRWRFTASSRVFVHVCVPLTSEALTRPSWKEQLEGSWVHKLRYLHQWQRKALFTQDRHLHGHTHKNTQGGRECQEKGNAVKERQRVCQSGGKCHRGNEFRSQVGTCCCCALAVGTVPNSCRGQVLPAYIFHDHILMLHVVR